MGIWAPGPRGGALPGPEHQARGPVWLEGCQGAGGQGQTLRLTGGWPGHGAPGGLALTASPAGETLAERLGSCHHDAGQTGGGIERGHVTGSGHSLEIKPTGLADGLDVGCDRRVVRMPAALGNESMELVTPLVGP